MMRWGEGAAGKARESVLLLGRERRFDELLAALRRDRPEAFDRANLGSDVETLYVALPAFEASDVPAKREFYTEGGTHVKGRVETSSGDFVGRDKHVHGDEVHSDKVTYQGSAYPV